LGDSSRGVRNALRAAWRRGEKMLLARHAAPHALPQPRVAHRCSAAAAARARAPEQPGDGEEAGQLLFVLERRGEGCVASAGARARFAVPRRAQAARHYLPRLGPRHARTA
jgi:hypothetical protein